MKKIIFLISLVAFLSSADAQLIPKAKCDDFYVDILDGRVNGVRPDFTMGQIKDKLPCFTSSDPEGTSSSKCGGTVFFADKGVYFYTDRDYIEIKESYKGKISIPVLGADRKSLFKWLGNPTLKDDAWDAFETKYGILVLHYNKLNKVNLVQMTTKSTSTLNLCQ
jgi:hypothetical protein